MNRLLRICIVAMLLCGCARERDLPRLGGDTLPATPYTHLVFRAYVDQFTVVVGGRQIYSFEDAQVRERLTLHVVTLPPGSAGQPIAFMTKDASQSDRFGDDPLLATEATLPFAIEAAAIGSFREAIPNTLLAITFVVIGIVALIASWLRRRGDVLIMRGLGGFTVLYGARLLVDSYVPLLAGLPLSFVLYAEPWITYVIPIAGWFVPMRLIGNGWKDSLRWQVIAFAVFAPIAILSDIITRTPGSLEQINNVLVIAGGINILGNLLRAQERRSGDLRVVLAGSLVFLLFAINNNLSALGLLPWRAEAETVGFLVFVTTLGYASTRAFLRGEKERVAIDNELETAREIQQSILPASMPRVPGLEVQAGYDPATSVAGDLYDFLRAGETHVGVLVADVAGHGVPAALIASMVKIAASSQARIADQPADLLRELNHTLRTEVRRAFVTATYLWFDMERQLVSVSNAGHAPPLLLRDGTFHELGVPGVLLGRFANVRYEAREAELVAGDRIVAFTDGIVEARNGREEQFGEERLRELLLRGQGDAASVAAAVLAAVHEWRVDDDADDLTIVVVDVSR